MCLASANRLVGTVVICSTHCTVKVAIQGEHDRQLYSILVVDGDGHGVVAVAFYLHQHDNETVTAAISTVVVWLWEVHGVRWNLLSMMMDDSPTERLAVRSVWPDVWIRLCIWHIIHRSVETRVVGALGGPFLCCNPVPRTSLGPRHLLSHNRNVESCVTGYFSKPVAVALVTLLWKAVRKTGHRTEGGPVEPIEMLVQLVHEVYALVGSPAINVDSVYHPSTVEALLRSGVQTAWLRFLSPFFACHVDSEHVRSGVCVRLAVSDGAACCRRKAEGQRTHQDLRGPSRKSPVSVLVWGLRVNIPAEGCMQGSLQERPPLPHQTVRGAQRWGRRGSLH